MNLFPKQNTPLTLDSYYSSKGKKKNWTAKLNLAIGSQEYMRNEQDNFLRNL